MLRKIVYVVLAAGSARRMGFDKAATPLAGSSPLARLAAVLGGRTAVIVAAETKSRIHSAEMPTAIVLINPNPSLGMTSSLLVAHRAIDETATLAVLLADKPFVTRETLELCERAHDATPACDVLVPAIGGTLGHPVFFAPNARARLESLAPGDTLQGVRDDPELRMIAVPCLDPGILVDLDTPEAWRVAERGLSGA